MKKRVVYWVICIGFFVLYFKILKLVWNMFIPFNALTDVISLLILVCVNIPLSLICTERVFKIIKKD